MTVTLSENLYCPSLHLYLINVSTDIDESLRRKKEGKKKLYAGCKQIELCLKEENAAGGMGTKCPVRKRQRFSAAGCAIYIIHLLLLEIELLCLTGCALNGSILITLGIINIGLSCCAAKCVIVSVLAIILIMDSSSLKLASLTQDSNQLFFFSPSCFLLHLISKSFNHPFLSLSALQEKVVKTDLFFQTGFSFKRV